jgi:hypothetical protein
MWINVQSIKKILIKNMQIILIKECFEQCVNFFHINKYNTVPANITKLSEISHYISIVGV